MKKILSILLLINLVMSGQGTLLNLKGIQRANSPGDLLIGVPTGTLGNVWTCTTSINWNKISSTPTTLSGYGITNAIANTQSITVNGISKLLTSATFTTPLSQILGIGNSVGGQDITSTDGDAYLQLTSGSSLNLANNYGTFGMSSSAASLQHTSIISLDAPSVQINGSDAATLGSFSATSPLFYNSSTGTFSIQPATALQPGIVTAIDWGNFNAKVNSVNGTTNRITSSGGVNPTIDISSTFEATLSKIANRIDQNNASTTSAQLATVVSDETGGGVAVFSSSPTISSPTLTGITTASTTNYTGPINEFKGADVASSATVNLTANYSHITGTVSITSFGTAQAGTRRIVVFDGSLALISNSVSLILPGNTSIQTSANDAAVFVSEGSGNWRCVSYSAYDGSYVNYSPTYTGFSTPPTVNAGDARYKMLGPKTCHVVVQTGGGTSNATTMTITLPFAADGQQSFIIATTDAGTSAIGSLRTTNGSAIATCYKNAIGTTWTNSGNKGAFFSLVYVTQ